MHLVLVRPGEDTDAKVAALADFALGDELMVVRFVRPGDAVTPVAH